MGVDMHPYCCYVHVVILWYIIHQNHYLAWQLTWLDGLAVEHAYWKGEVLGSNLCRESISLIRDFDLSAQEETDKTLISCFFHLTIFFAPCNSPQLCTGTLHLHQKKDPISCPILTTISVAIIPRYRDTRYCTRYWSRYQVCGLRYRWHDDPISGNLKYPIY